MKKSILTKTPVFLLLTFFMMVVLSCSKNDDKQSGDGSISLKIDGTSWDASLAVEGIFDQGLFTVTGSDSNGKQVNLTVMNPGEGKTYSTGGLGNYTIMGRWTAGLNTTDTYSTAAMTSVSGEIKFTTFSETRAEGTFSFRARNTSQSEVSVTDGQFSVNF